MNSSLKNTNLSKARSAKNDEFYTQYADIEKEMNAYLEYNPNTFKGKVVLLPCDDPEWSNFTLYFAQNFSRLGLRKLISTSYAHTSKHVGEAYQPSLFEQDSPQFDSLKSSACGKFFELESDITKDGVVDINDIHWQYLNGDGDFRSDEVKALRDQSDIIVTNPPFSLFRDFIAWIMEGEKKFAIVGNMNSLTYKDIFPLIQKNIVWLGATISSGDREFRVPDSYPLNAAGFRIDDEGNKYIRVKGVRWFTNLEHGRRHEPLQLMTMEDNKRFNTKLVGKNAYQQYDNYKAMEVPFTQAIPSDYDGVMGVPISFLDKYNPEQFEILGMDFYVKDGLLENISRQEWSGKLDRAYLNEKRLYSRVLVSHKRI